ncbi:hypothetical protein NMY22_g10398 [Coprinellus aureogranulatus]|nr:hypothetical protein NMY22_g10398 [Coprinellus aureogranulatus]
MINTALLEDDTDVRLQLFVDRSGGCMLSTIVDGDPFDMLDFVSNGSKRVLSAIRTLPSMRVWSLKCLAMGSDGAIHFTRYAQSRISCLRIRVADSGWPNANIQEQHKLGKGLCELHQLTELSLDLHAALLLLPLLGLSKDALEAMSLHSLLPRLWYICLESCDCVAYPELFGNLERTLENRKLGQSPVLKVTFIRCHVKVHEALDLGQRFGCEMVFQGRDVGRFSETEFISSAIEMPRVLNFPVNTRNIVVAPMHTAVSRQMLTSLLGMHRIDSLLALLPPPTHRTALVTQPVVEELDILNIRPARYPRCLVQRVMNSFTDRGWHPVLTYVYLKLLNEEAKEAITGIGVVKRTRASLVSLSLPFLPLHPPLARHRVTSYVPLPLSAAKSGTRTRFDRWGPPLMDAEDSVLSRWCICWWLTLHLLFSSTPICSAQQAFNQQNVTIPLDPDEGQVVYTPFFCNATRVETDPESCTGAWYALFLRSRILQLANTDDLLALDADMQSGFSDSGLPIVTSAGQNPATGNILPQIFFRFRGSQAFLNMVPSNSTVNVTISANNITIMHSVQASLGTATIVNIPGNAITTLTITVLPTPANSVPFSLLSLVITTPIDADSTSIFPTATLPSPIPVSTWFTLTTTSLATSTITMPSQPQPTSNRRRMIAQAVGITVGLGLGLTGIAVGAFFYWKKRRRIARLWGRSVSRVEFD